ncbi:hypothetical protein IV203_008018 [Nitzschia inconspicua]|uniref:Uncharacterized protein n=1 Tax=Nitzschia inconspicua TaxID=303405 RepID=A0A9K3PLJ6_9STRA|nr:hypothetical protein IV203_008018 [Nitzschia inconspicua]
MGKKNTIHSPNTSNIGIHRPSSMSSHRHPLSPESQIRLRLLNRLGIHKKVDAPISGVMEQRRKHTLYNNKNSYSPIRRQPVLFCQPLKDDDEDGGLSSPKLTVPRSTPSSTCKQNHEGIEKNQQQSKQNPKDRREHKSEEQNYDRSHRRIQFNNNVMVVPIPSRHAYSKRIKQAFWMNGAELQANAERNRYEFASEGWDFHQVLEDEDFYVNTVTGQLVHPCWVEDEDDCFDGDGNVDGDIGEKNLPPLNDEEQNLEIKSPTLKRTNSGVLELQSLAIESERE